MARGGRGQTRTDVPNDVSLIQNLKNKYPNWNINENIHDHIDNIAKRAGVENQLHRSQRRVWSAPRPTARRHLRLVRGCLGTPRDRGEGLGLLGDGADAHAEHDVRDLGEPQPQGLAPMGEGVVGASLFMTRPPPPTSQFILSVFFKANQFWSSEKFS